MGIKGIYRELGPGKRISLAKLATEKLENTNRPLRIAIDIAIWQFQTQAARGGTNPAIRTLFYRLVRLRNLGIHPIFVFDGPHKPAFKRNKRSGKGDGVAIAMAKRVIRLFGFPVHDAPGEAEAECALLQQQKIVDAVLSEDVDTIMFGCTRTLRNWTAEGTRGSKTPTHISMYEVNDVLSAETGLDREGMVLVALMSGGDYIPEGVPGCGPKVACEAAKAGFGKSICRLKIEDDAQFDEWRMSLRHELRTNESGFFRVKHKALSIPDEFPDRQVLRYYTHPVVSSATTINRLKAGLDWSGPIDVQGLRYFAEETLDWVNKIGAIKLTRVLSPGLLVHKLLERHLSDQASYQTTAEMENVESKLINRITGTRSHHSTDGIQELRVAHIPTEIVGLDLSQELDEAEEVPFDRQGLGLNSDEEFEAATDGEGVPASSQVAPKSTFDPYAAQLIWLPESLVKLGAPLTVEDWEEKQRSKASTKPKSTSSKGVGKRKPTKAAPPEAGALDRWMQITKGTTKQSAKAGGATSQHQVDNEDVLPPHLPRPTVLRPDPSKITATSFPASSSFSSQRPTPLPRPTNRSKQSRPNGKVSATAEPTAHSGNPWAYAGSQHMPRITKPRQPAEPILLSSSPVRASPAPACSLLKTPLSPLRSPPSPPPNPPLSPQQRIFIDLSDSDEDSFVEPEPIRATRRPNPPTASAAAPRHRPSQSPGKHRPSTRGSSPVLPTTPSKSQRGLKQTRMDSFVTAGTTARSMEQENIHDRQPRRIQSDVRVETSITVSKTANVKPVGSKDVPAAGFHGFRTTKVTASSWLESDDAFAPKPTAKAASGEARRKVMVPRTSVNGFFRVVEVSDEEWLAGTKAMTASERLTKDCDGWRQSEVSIIDLTGDDE
ncbi:hypothetical protein BDP81DRAFT_179647 [Colletotrichum phormii]|uniref:Flap endonuclease GEN-like protein 1 n=1 Tax=Colletotrichum phormii TaxID=359342 RepID=A0AAI9ZWM5_9PEZI|nr:uncharacterized protein BDP81DRAFT_179647 [Colletotrichum phormii]KAK1639567.1 hypothetical protein BDP81DRAFT_179647 [Colletotrichum phormii]